MQFRLSQLFSLTTLAALLTLGASIVYRHWDVRSIYRGYYGPSGVPDWATGTGRDVWAESFGQLAHFGVDQGPWMVIMALCCFAGAIGIHVKGGAR